jgi:hypothetical protein
VEFYGLLMMIAGGLLMAAILWATLRGRGHDDMIDSVNDVAGIAPEANKEIKIAIREADTAMVDHDYDFGPSLKARNKGRAGASSDSYEADIEAS